jgi:hypothetical protein
MTRADALTMFSENLSDIKIAAETNYEYKISQLERPQFGWYPMFFVKSGMYLIRHQQITSKFKPLLRSLEIQLNPRNDTNELNVEKAKDYPIENLLAEPPRRGMVRCPLHEEKTPSCKIKNNKFTCYGACGAYGDVIDLYMKLHNTSFVEAVKALQ